MQGLVGVDSGCALSAAVAAAVVSGGVDEVGAGASS